MSNQSLVLQKVNMLVYIQYIRYEYVHIRVEGFLKINLGTLHGVWTQGA